MARSPMARRDSAPGSRLITTKPACSQPGDLTLHAAVHGPPEPAVGPVGAAVGRRHGGDDDHHVEPLGPEDVRVRGRMHAAVDVLGAADVDGLEVAGDGARGQDGSGQACRRGAGAAEDDPGPVRAPDGADAQALRPATAHVLVESPGPLGDVDPAPGQQRHGRHVGPEGQRPADDAGDEGGGRKVPGPQQRADRGRRERSHVVGEDATEDGAAPA